MARRCSHDGTLPCELENCLLKTFLSISLTFRSFSTSPPSIRISCVNKTNLSLFYLN